MMKAAIEGLTRPDGTRPLLIAVTQLTSTSEEVMRETESDKAFKVTSIKPRKTNNSHNKAR